MKQISAQPRFSLLVATVGRRQPLRKLFAGLNRQTYRNFEVLIADQNPSGYLDDTLSMLDSDIRVKHVLLDVKGLSRARNALLPLAEGDVVAFPDDDCRYLPHTLERLVTLFSGAPHLGGLFVSWSDAEQSGFSYGGIRQPDITELFRKACSIVQFYRRPAIEGLQFDPELGAGAGTPYGSGEDTDFALQVRKRGVLTGIVPEVLVCHPKVDMADPAVIDKSRSYAFGRMYLLRKHHFPLWFKLANIVYPLVRLPLEGPKAWPYRKAMFLGRLHAFFRCRKGGN